MLLTLFAAWFPPPHSKYEGPYGTRLVLTPSVLFRCNVSIGNVILPCTTMQTRRGFDVVPTAGTWPMVSIGVRNLWVGDHSQQSQPASLQMFGPQDLWLSFSGPGGFRGLWAAATWGSCGDPHKVGQSPRKKHTNTQKKEKQQQQPYARSTTHTHLPIPPNPRLRLHSPRRQRLGARFGAAQRRLGDGSGHRQRTATKNEAKANQMAVGQNQGHPILGRILEPILVGIGMFTGGTGF